MSNNGKLTLEDVGGFLAKLAEHSESVYWLSSPDFQSIEYVSPAFEKIWGRSREELYKNPEQWISYLHPDDAADHHPITAMAERVKRLGSEARYEENYRIVRPNGEVRWLIDRGFPIYNEKGECCGVTGVAVDATRERRAQEVLKKAKEEAEMANQAKTAFIHNMEHDIRTPFTGVYGMANILVKREEDSEKRVMLNDIALCAKELLDYCNAILDFSRIDSGAQPLVSKLFNIEEMLASIIMMEKPPAVVKEIDLDLVVDADVPQNLLGDEHRLKRTLINLVSNAIKFTNEGHVKLIVSLSKASDDGRRVVLKFAIEDTGIGIPEDKKELIYERFTRVSPSNKGQFKGQGLGLRIVKQFVDEMDGDLHLKSEVGKGSTFTVFLPFKTPLSDELVGE